MEGHNNALVDLFDLDHARRVLGLFGRAYGKLPDSTRDWTTSTLREVGGARGIGTTFLEETFSASIAPKQHRVHEQAARAVLAALLPEHTPAETGEDHADSAQVSRLGASPGSNATQPGLAPKRLTPAPDRLQNSYQLTHDFLVPSLREWLTQKQQETRTGRAELLLAERSAQWNTKPESRYLPSLTEWAGIRTLTQRNKWTAPQQTMMKNAGRVHGLHWGVALAVVLLIGVTGQQITSSVEQRNVAKRVQTAVASLNSSRGIIQPSLASLEEYPRKVLVDELQTQFANSTDSHKLPLAFAFANFGDVRVDFLLSQVPHANPDEAGNFADALKHAEQEALQAIDVVAADCDKTAAAAEQVTDDKALNDSGKPALPAWRHKARLAMLGLALGEPSVAANMCQLRADPIQRTVFIDECQSWCGDLTQLSELARTLDDGDLRSALCLVVGGVSLNRVTSDQQEAWQTLLADWYQNQRDTSTHSASGWALRKWELPLPQLPVGEPTRSEEQEQQIAELTNTLADLEKERANLEDVPSDLQVSWEQELRARPLTLDDSFSEGMAAHYKFDESDGTEITNSVDGRPGGIYRGGEEPKRIPGIIGNALRLNVQGQYVDCEKAFAPENTDVASFGCWFLVDPDSQRGTLFGKFDNELQRGFAVSVSPEEQQVICEWSHHYPENTLILRAEMPEMAGR